MIPAPIGTVVRARGGIFVMLAEGWLWLPGDS